MAASVRSRDDDYDTFVEPYEAYDFEGQRYVACKVHQLASEWKDEKRANYLKHAGELNRSHVTLLIWA